jgi:hypothetical protein
MRGSFGRGVGLLPEVPREAGIRREEPRDEGGELAPRQGVELGGETGAVLTAPVRLDEGPRL